MKRNRKLLVVIAPLLVAIACIVIFDILAYFFVPKDLVGFAPMYRRKAVTAEGNWVPSNAYGYPRGYFRADEELGFDIQPNSGLKKYATSDASFDIFSNELGCFDKNTLGQIKKASEYVYFGGDSFTWGYADYDKKYPTVYESRSGVFSVKCGVSHTGQRHQYEKFLRVVKAIGRYPKRVFVGYFQNDPANDFAYPHSTVIDGFLVDTVELKNHALAQRDMNEITNAVRDWIKNASNSPQDKSRTVAPVEQFLARYSLTAHLISNAVIQLKYLARMMTPSAAKSFYEVSRQFSFKESYRSSDITIANRAAIRKWASDAKTNHYALIFLLIPLKDEFNNSDYYRSLKQFLGENDIAYYDLTEAFRDAKKTASELYWGKDVHWNNEGNAFVGEWLAKRFPE